MTKWCLALAIVLLAFAPPLRAFDWETATADGREYVTLHSFCLFYGFSYAVPSGNDRFVARNGAHSVSFKVGTSDAYLDGVHYVLSFPIEGGDHDWLVSRMDVIKLFEPLLRPEEISGRHTIRGVVIDAGHGGSDNGASSRLGNEKTYTLDTARRLEAILRNAGLRTVLTRNSDVFVDLYERAHIASLYSDYCFVSIHFNSAEAEARGLETYCLSPRGAASTSSRYLTRGDIQKLPGNDYDTQNILLASMVHSEIIKLNPGDATADRGVKRARFVVIKANVLPAILVEGGFVSNHFEAARVNRPDYRQALAEAIARGVIKFANAMGDRHMAMPSFFQSLLGGSSPAPKPIPIAEPAPSGLLHDSFGETSEDGGMSGPNATRDKTGAPTTGSSTSLVSGPPVHKSKHKHKQAGQTAANSFQLTKPSPPTAQNTAVSAPGSTSPAVKTEGKSEATTTSSGGTALNLADPATPKPSPEMDKAPAEPDEPPTVSVYPTGPVGSSPPATNSTRSPAAPASREP
jgi:N-acetylmuramoyl-L-alanine amidase